MSDSTLRQTLQLTPLLQLRHQAWDKPSIWARLSFQIQSLETEVPRLLALYIQARFPSPWRPQVFQSSDWLSFCFLALPDQGQALREQLFSLLKPLPPIPPAILQRLNEQLKLEPSTQSLNSKLRQTLIQLAFPQHPESSLLELSPETPRKLAELWQKVQKHVPIYLELSEPRNLLNTLSDLTAYLEDSPAEPLPAQPLRSPEAPGFQKQTLEIHLQGAWILWGFRLPGLADPHWLNGYLLKFWLEQLGESQALTPEQLELNMLAWQDYSLLYGCFYVPRTHEVEQIKYGFLNQLKLALDNELTPNALQKSLQRCHKIYQTEIEILPPDHPLNLARLTQGENYIPQRLQLLKFSSLKKTVQTYLHRDNFVLLECLSPHIRKKSAPELAQILAPPIAPLSVRSTSAATGWLKEPQTLDLNPQTQVLLYPCQGARQICLGARFSSGSTHDRVTGTTALLLNLLQRELISLVQKQGFPGNSVKTNVDQDSAWFYWQVPAERLEQALPLLPALLALPRLTREALESGRQALIAKYQNLQLNNQAQALQAFYQTGFNNHPYARPIEGDYHALLQITPEDLELRLHELFSPLYFSPQIIGAISNQAEAAIQAAWGNLPLYKDPPAYKLPREIHPRRGEIHVESLAPTQLRLQGQIFPEPLAANDLPVLFLLQTWLQDVLYQSLGNSCQVHFALHDRAWLYTLTTPSAKNLQYWWHPLLKIRDKSLTSYQYQTAIKQRQRHFDLTSCWADLCRVQSSGYRLKTLSTLDKAIIQLNPEIIQTFLQNWLASHDHWLQIVFKT